MEGRLMKQDLTFIHAADLHLDSPFRGLANIPEHIFADVLNSTFQALDNLVNVAIEREVDFILLAGDLFDNERKSLKAQIHLRNAFEKLNHYNINVYLSYGNHDFINGNVHQLEYPKNVYCFPDENVRHVIHKKNDDDIAAIYGFSYENQAIKSNKTSEYVVSQKNIPYHIAILHGNLTGQTDHDTYAPFQLRDLTEKEFDYWALGHIHQRNILSENPPVIYPGNTQGRHRKEWGEKGCYHVKLSETDTELSFVPLQSIIFVALNINIDKRKSITQLEQILKREMEKQLTNSPQLVHLTIQNSLEENSLSKNDPHFYHDLIDIMNDMFMNQKNWLYIYRYTVSNKKTESNQEFFEGDYFISELTSKLIDSPIDPYLNDLYQHRQARKHLDVLSDQEQEMIRKEAYDLLLGELLD